jgi:hypothetical protein
MGKSLNKALFEITSSLGIHPKWERDLLQTDYHLQTYKRWQESNKCSYNCCRELYYNRIQFLKGWIE